MLEWRAVTEDRSGLDVAASRVTVTLPFALSADELDAQAFGPAYAVDLVESAGGQRIVFEAQGPVADGTPFQVLVNFPPGWVTAVAQPWQTAEDAAELAYAIDRIDMMLTLQEDGRLVITEQQQISVSAGALYTGSRQLSWLYSDGIHVEQISEGDLTFTPASGSLDDCDDCYAIKEDRRIAAWARYSEVLDEVAINSDLAGATLAEWRFPALVRGEATTFRLVYTVDGAVRHNEDGTQELTWTAPSASLSAGVPGYDVPVDAVQLHLALPGGMGLEDVQISGAQTERGADGAILLTPDTAVSADTAWSFNVTLPPGTITGPKPEWQTELEAAFASAEAYRARQAKIDLAWLVGKIGVGVTAVLGTIAGWYLWGSRKLREMMGNYRTTPPSDLPPGLVAYLVEGQPTPSGILASLFYLANLGLIRVNLDGETLTLERMAANLVSPGATITMANGELVKLPGHAAYLFNALLPVMPAGESVTLAAIQPSLQKALPGLYAAMGEEMVGHFYGRGGSEWRGLLKQALPIIWFGATAVFMFSFVSGGFNRGRNPAILFAVMFGGFFVFVFFMRRLDGRRTSLTELGRKEAARWRGFEAYLQEIQRYGALEEAQAIVERYFAYAVALGVEQELLDQVKVMGGWAPRWLGNGRSLDGTSWHNQPIGRPPLSRYGRWQRRWQRGSWLPRPPRPQTSPTVPVSGGVSLQKLSDQLTGSLKGASRGITSLLNTAVGEGGPVDVSISGAGQRQPVAQFGTQQQFAAQRRRRAAWV